MGRRPRAESTLSTIRISARHHDTGRAPSGYPSLSAMKQRVYCQLSAARAGDALMSRDRIAATSAVGINRLLLLFNHLFFVFSVR